MPAAIATKKILAVLALLAIPMLASCSGGGESSASPSPLPVVQMDAQQLKAKLAEFGKGLPKAKVFDDRALRSSIPAAQEWMENMEVTPSKCGVTFAAPITEQLKNSTMGAIEYQDGYLTVALFKDEETLKEQWEAKLEENAGCSRYTVKSGNESRAYHLAKQPIDSPAEMNESYVVTSSNGSSTEQQLIVRSATSNVLIGLQEPTSKDSAAEQLKAATETMQALLEQLN
ncbi:hypothetical protein [Glutamicibacter sp.]|uniref:hypothetical protein n=1 Tax=Glutamicibacter sp. TaxID=1931995 RepID=UPI003D6B2AF1